MNFLPLNPLKNPFKGFRVSCNIKEKYCKNLQFAFRNVGLHSETLANLHRLVFLILYLEANKKNRVCQLH